MIYNILITNFKGLNYCHRNNVIHRDIKLENIMIDEKSKCAKMIDFGFSIAIPKVII